MLVSRAFGFFAFFALGQVCSGSSESYTGPMCKLAAMIPSDQTKNGWICEKGSPVTDICSGNFSSWEGVTCENNQIYAIRISHKKLRGDLPESLGDLKALKFLSLFQTRIEGTIPASLGNLKSLLHLSLQGNQFVGTIPAEIGGLSNLKELWLSSNQLTGEIPSSFRDLTNILFIGLSNNKLTGQIPSLQNLKKLKSLQIQNNNLSGIISPTLCDIPALNSLYLYWPPLAKTQVGGNSEFTCYPNCLSKLRDKKLGSLPVCSEQQLKSLDESSAPGLGDFADMYFEAVFPGLKTLLTLFGPVIGLESASGTIPIVWAFGSQTTAFTAADLTEGLWRSLYTTLGAYRSLKRSVINYIMLGREDKITYEYKTKDNKRYRHVKNVKRTRSTAGIFFYRRSAGATIAVATGLAVLAGAISFSIASVLYPARLSRYVNYSVVPGAHETAAPAA